MALPPSWRVFGRPISLIEKRKTEDLVPLMQAAFAAGGYFRLYPSGRSMLPLLREGIDSVLLARPDVIRRGDILLVDTREGFLLHRAIKKNRHGITLAGDALTSTEGPFPEEAVLACVVRIYRGDVALDPASLRLRAYAARRALRRRVARAYHWFRRK